MSSILCANDLDIRTNANIETKSVTTETKDGGLNNPTFVVDKEDKHVDGEELGNAASLEINFEPGPDPYRMHYGVDDVPAIHLTVLFGLQVKLVIVNIFSTTNIVIIFILLTCVYELVN